MNVIKRNTPHYTITTKIILQSPHSKILFTNILDGRGGFFWGDYVIALLHLRGLFSFLCWSNRFGGPYMEMLVILKEDEIMASDISLSG